ncbi:Alpha/beta hydrolase family-domain-containing protein [Paraphoma chrysanthemicola]|nr:Alpha/beta hydrolase family-domain-containing protein [Paraphoma chrysanthemicola]
MPGATKHQANSPGTNMAQLNPMMAAQRYSSNPQKFSVAVPVANSMNPSEEELPPFPEPEISSTMLDHKPGAKIQYTYYPASKSTKSSNPFSQTLIVFLNGMMLPRSGWDPSIQSFLEKRIVGRLPYPGLLSYDRYGQGDSDRDPSDKDPPPCHGHDAMAVVQDLKQLILQIWREHLDIAKPTHFPCLIFVCNSMGCALARLFAQQYPGTVSGLLFLDSIMANSDYQSFWPDPDAPDFNEHTLPSGVTPEEVRETRRKYREMFHPDVPSMEGLSRRNLVKLLPHSDGPRLEGYLGKGPYLTVVGHDWETFAEQSFTGSLHTPKILTMTYANPAWRRYNEGLTRITDDGRSIGPIVAVDCGHFIQKDGPGFVSDELVSLLDRVVNRVEQVSERGGST